MVTGKVVVELAMDDTLNHFGDDGNHGYGSKV